jgi:hypothetical protein
MRDARIWVIGGVGKNPIRALKSTGKPSNISVLPDLCDTGFDEVHARLPVQRPTRGDTNITKGVFFTFMIIRIMGIVVNFDLLFDDMSLLLEKRVFFCPATS